MMKLFKFFLFLIFLLTGIIANGQRIERWKLDDLKNAVNHSSKPTILNFWATFCKPCIEEIPYFQEAVKQDTSVELILVSLDMPEVYEKLPSIAKKYGFTARIVYLDETNADLFCPIVDEKWSGVMPASIFINPQTGYRKFFEDKIAEEKFRAELNQLTRKN
jgi:thiol-disulfide isomerase/thioredoxin